MGKQRGSSSKKHSFGSEMPDIEKLVKSGFYKNSLNDLITITDEDGSKHSFTDFVSGPDDSVATVQPQQPQSKQFSFKSMLLGVDDDTSKKKTGDDDTPSEDDCDAMSDDDDEQQDNDSDEEMSDAANEEPQQQQQPQWTSMSLDKRLVAAAAKLGFSLPTAVQHQAIPLILQGRDIIAKARTGTGKTAAYVIPALQQLLDEELLRQDGHAAQSKTASGARVLCIVPTHELATQVYNEFQKFLKILKTSLNCYYLGALAESDVQATAAPAPKKGATSKKATAAATAAQSTSKLRKQQLHALDPQIVIGTPSQLLQMLESNEAPSLARSLRMVIIDEADLVLDKQFQIIQQLVTSHLPRQFQCVMMSATLKPKGLSALKQYLAKTRPVELDCTTTADSAAGTLFEHFIRLGQALNTAAGGATEQQQPVIEKILLTNYIIRYKAKDGKVLVFVESLEDAYLLCVSLRKLGITNCLVLSPEFPLLTKYDIMERFNKTNEINVLITLDAVLQQQEETNDEALAKLAQRYGDRTDKGSDFIEQYKEAMIDKEADKEMFNIARGIDFQDVVAVINYDVPESPQAYVHRVGRAGRGGKTGIAITILDYLTPLGKLERGKRWEKIVQSQKGNGVKITAYKEIVYDNINRLSYRFTEVFKEISSTLKRRMRETLKKEIANAKKIKRQGLCSKHVKHDIGSSTEEGEAAQDESQLPSYLDIKNEQVDSRLQGSGLLKTDKAEAAAVAAKTKKIVKQLEKHKRVDDEEMEDSSDDEDAFKEETESKVKRPERVLQALRSAQDLDPLRAASAKKANHRNKGVRKLLEQYTSKPNADAIRKVKKSKKMKQLQKELVRSTLEAQWTQAGER